MDLPKNEAIIDFDEVGETTGKKYDGRFTTVCILNMGKKHQLELEKTRLMADFTNPTDGLFGIATILANLRVKVTDGPNWWKQSGGGLDIEDEDVLIKLYKCVLDKEIEWRDAVKKKVQEATPAGNAPAESK